MTDPTDSISDAARSMQRRSAQSRWAKLSPEQRSTQMRQLQKKSAAARWSKLRKPQKTALARRIRAGSKPANPENQPLTRLQTNPKKIIETP